MKVRTRGQIKTGHGKRKSMTSVNWHGVRIGNALIDDVSSRSVNRHLMRNPYPGKLGVVEQGALADVLLVNGDPIANIKLIENPAKNFVVIMKDGKVFKNTL